MRWRRTQNTGIEDRRGMRGAALPIGGLGGIGAIIFLILQLVGGGSELGSSLDDFNSAADPRSQFDDAPDPDKDLVDFLGFVVEDIQQSWSETFADAGQDYRETDLVLFERATQTGCGIGSQETGPFYCPADSKVYLDLGFFRELRDRFGAPGDFAQAYVVAHEFGHHVQNLLGINEAVQNAQQDDPGAANELSIKIELQADCFAGIWGHAAFNEDLLESGDLEEGLDAAAAVGDDRLQQQATGRIDRETWTHGSSAQRVDWFKRGFDSGNADECNTFG